MSTEETNWVEEMRQIAKDFEGADVKSFRFTKIRGKITCTAAVLNADRKLVMWELVDDSVSADRWRKLASKEFNEETHRSDDPLLGNLHPSEVRKSFLDTMRKTPSTKKPSFLGS